MRRREFVAGVAALLAPLPALPASERVAEPVRIGLTPVFLDDQVSFLNAWRDYLESRLARPVLFVQRGSYREIVELLRQEKLEFAWVCGYPFVRYRQQLRLLAVPLYNGGPLYRSYLIVPSSDRATRSILDLRGKVFAYSDPDSNSGYLFPNYALAQLKESPNAFFGKTFYTWAHRKVVEAVAAQLAQGGAVDGYVWDTLAKFNPELTVRTRVVEKSPEFGFPPFVARANVGRSIFAGLRRVLLEMPDDAQGRTLLRQLNLDGFVAGSESLFDGIDHMFKATARSGHVAPA